jgi:hypothetical protein
MPHQWWIFRHILSFDGGFLPPKIRFVFDLEKWLTPVFSPNPSLRSIENNIFAFCALFPSPAGRLPTSLVRAVAAFPVGQLR